jgi:GNAT superfamily N-acetyltransferase
VPVPVGLRVVRFENLTPSLTDGILHLLERTFPKWPNLSPPVDAREHFKWKFGDFPGGVSLGLAEVESTPVGLAAVMRRTWLVAGRPVAVHDGVDVAVDPDWRGQGVYSRMFKFGKENVDPDFDMSLWYLTQPLPMRAARRDGFLPPRNPVRVLGRAGSAFRVARRARQRGTILPSHLVAFGLWAHRVMNRMRYASHRPKVPQCSIRRVDRFDVRVDDLARLAQGTFDFIQERNARYLNWRYADRAAGQFTIGIAENGRDLLGYIVIKVSGDQGYVADLLVAPDRDDVAEWLLHDALAQLDTSHGCDVVSWLPRFHPYAESFRRAGFVDTRRNSGAAYRPIRLGAERLAFLSDRRARIHLMIGDSDHV